MITTQQIEKVMTYGWVKAMPELQREFFKELLERQYPSSFAKKLAEEKYNEVITEGMAA